MTILMCQVHLMFIRRLLFGEISGNLILNYCNWQHECSIYIHLLIRWPDAWQDTPVVW